MKAIWALAVVCLFSQAHGQAAGQVVMVNGEATKVCQDCLNFFTDVQQMLSSTNTTAEIEQLVKQMLCSQFGSLRTMCDDLVDMYVPLGLKYLAGLEDPRQLCGVIGMCTEKMMELVKLKARMPRGEECVLCKTVINELKSLVRDQGTQTAIKNFIENTVCPLLGSLAAECKQEVDDYAALVFQVLVNELDPVVVCETFGLCNQTKKVFSLSRVGLTSSATKVKVMHSEKSKVMMPKKLKGECVLCEMVLKEIDDLLEQNTTEAAVEAALDKVCSLLPSTVSGECTTFVDEYSPVIFKLLVQEVSPSEVCQVIGLCQKKVTIRADPKCVVCEFVMKEIDGIIGNNRSEANVEAALEKVCGLMPDTISEECEQFVKEYGPAVINLLINDLDPKAVCKTLRFCTSDKHAAVKKPVQRKMKASPACVICEYVMKELDTILGDNRTEQEIEHALDQVCSILPSTVRDTCVDFVNTYAPAIVELLLQEIDPEQVCTTLGLCQSAAMRKRVLQAKPLKDSETCDACVTALTYVEALLKENGTVQEVKDLLDKVCNFLPDAIKPQCIQFVNDYSALVLNMIVNNLDPRQICEEIDVCNSSRKAFELKNNRLYFKPSNLGTNECTYGPAYWCASKENAIKCGAKEHCMKHVWN